MDSDSVSGLGRNFLSFGDHADREGVPAPGNAPSYADAAGGRTGGRRGRPLLPRLFQPMLHGSGPF